MSSGRGKGPKHTVLLQAVWCGSLIARSTFRSYFIKPSESRHHSFPLPPRSAQRAFGDLWRKYSPDHFPSQFHELSPQHCEKPLHQFPCSRNECSSSPFYSQLLHSSAPLRMALHMGHGESEQGALEYTLLLCLYTLAITHTDNMS